MNTAKIGAFLASLRKEKGLTQEQLGEKMGVSNKTVSRWETGNYLPPVEMLQQLSSFYGITINEILSGERLSEDTFLEKAEEYCIKQGKRYLRLDSAVGNQTLEEYYTSRGYVEAGQCVDGLYRGILRQKKLI